MSASVPWTNLSESDTINYLIRTACPDDRDRFRLWLEVQHVERERNQAREQVARLLDVAGVCAAFLNTRPGTDAAEDALVAMTYALQVCREAGDLPNEPAEDEA